MVQFSKGNKFTYIKYIYWEVFKLSKIDKTEKEETVNIYPPALTRSLLVFDYMAKVQNPVTIKELSKELTIPYSSIFRIVKCLTDYGYLRTPNNQNDRYVLGYKFLKFASMNTDGYGINDIVYPKMKELVDQTGQTCQLSILENKSLVIITQHVIPNNTITLIAKLGEKLPVNSCSSGKLLFAMLPEADRIKYFPEAFRYFLSKTEHTIMDPDVFLSHLQTIRQQGYSMDNEEYALGIGCFSAPIYDFTGEVVAALTLTGPVNFYTEPDSSQKILKTLFEICCQISVSLGFND